MRQFVWHDDGCGEKIMPIEMPDRNNLYDANGSLKEGAKLCEMFLLLPDRYKKGKQMSD